MGMGGPKPNPGALVFFGPIILLIIIAVIVYYIRKKKKEKKSRSKVREYEMGVQKGTSNASDIKANLSSQSIIPETRTTIRDTKEIETSLTSIKSENEWEKDGVTLKVENLSKNYGNHLAVDNISFEVYKGETIGLVGPNGAGKTTTIKMIAKLLKPTNGRILLKNKSRELQDINKSSRNLLKIGFLIDIPAFYVKMTAYQVLKYCALLDNYPRDKIDERIDELLKLFKLYDWKHEKIGTFSKGMTQKLGIIQAILHDPDIIIMDEPQTGLDPKARIEIRKFIRDIQAQGKTIFIASHMLYEISEVCDKIALINHGKIVAFDTIDNLEKSLKTKELNCVLLEPIDSSSLDGIINKLNEELEPYLDHELDPEISDTTILYYPEKKGIKIFYDGKEESRAKILNILIKDFESDFAIISYTQPKTSQLERIYSEMITDYAAIKITQPSEQEA
jgi:ABC-2 type transport system ATP-binding protein